MRQDARAIIGGDEVSILSEIIGRNDLALDLIRQFGSIPAVLGASPARLRRVAGMGEETVARIKAVLEAGRRLARQRFVEAAPVLGRSTALMEYLRVEMAFEEIEHFRMLFLDMKNRLIANEVQQHGTIDHTPAYPREIIKRALELSASALILVHNHPSGDPRPSAADVRMTNEIIIAAKPLGITIHDHLIIGRAGFASLAKLGLLGTSAPGA